MNEAPILARDLVLSAGRRLIVRVPTLEVPGGQTVAVLGRNGTGKTTLLRACLGLHRPAAGQLRVLGQEVASLGYWGRLRLRRRIGYVPQTMSAGGDIPLTLREVVALGPIARNGLTGRMRRCHWRTVDAWMESMGLSGLHRQRFCDASGGEQRRAMLARAMAQDPEILLLDEPTAWLDLSGREQIVRLLAQLHARTGITVILICHELEVLPPCCGRIVLLEAGAVAACGPPQTILTDASVSRLYGERLRVRHEGGRHTVLPCGETT